MNLQSHSVSPTAQFMDHDIQLKPQGPGELPQAKVMAITLLNQESQKTGVPLPEVFQSHGYAWGGQNGMKNPNDMITPKDFTAAAIAAEAHISPLARLLDSVPNQDQATAKTGAQAEQGVTVKPSEVQVAPGGQPSVAFPGAPNGAASGDRPKVDADPLGTFISKLDLTEKPVAAPGSAYVAPDKPTQPLYPKHKTEKLAVLPPVKKPAQIPPVVSGAQSASVAPKHSQQTPRRPHPAPPAAEQPDSAKGNYSQQTPRRPHPAPPAAEQPDSAKGNHSQQTPKRPDNSSALAPKAPDTHGNLSPYMARLLGHRRDRDSRKEAGARENDALNQKVTNFFNEKRWVPHVENYVTETAGATKKLLTSTAGLVAASPLIITDKALSVIGTKNAPGFVGDTRKRLESAIKDVRHGTEKIVAPPVALAVGAVQTGTAFGVGFATGVVDAIHVGGAIAAGFVYSGMPKREREAGYKRIKDQHFEVESGIPLPDGLNQFLKKNVAPSFETPVNGLNVIGQQINEKTGIDGLSGGIVNVIKAGATVMGGKVFIDAIKTTGKKLTVLTADEAAKIGATKDLIKLENATQKLPERIKNWSKDNAIPATAGVGCAASGVLLGGIGAFTQNSNWDKAKNAGVSCAAGAVIAPTAKTLLDPLLHWGSNAVRTGMGGVPYTELGTGGRMLTRAGLWNIFLDGKDAISGDGTINWASNAGLVAFAIPISVGVAAGAGTTGYKFVKEGLDLAKTVDSMGARASLTAKLFAPAAAEVAGVAGAAVRTAPSMGAAGFVYQRAQNEIDDAAKRANEISASQESIKKLELAAAEQRRNEQAEAEAKRSQSSQITTDANAHNISSSVRAAIKS